MSKKGKNYRAAEAKLEIGKLYSLEEAISLVKETSVTKFDSSVEVHMKLGVNPKHADQIVRGTIVLPAGTGKEVRVIAFVGDDLVATAKEAGAIEAGSNELIEKITKGWMDFDVAVAVPDMMKNLGKIAKTLGQKGMMPNPKAGTVTTDAPKTISEIRKGKVEYRTDKYGNVHNLVGKVSFDDSKLSENVNAFIKAIKDAKPSASKGTYIKSITLASSMGPGVKVDPSQV
ncbi:50S ribosomal protein L1 [Patescibacteria group bacterium]|nr:50S ribosomal protein L1 [Patescibacteria group bacterium]